MNSTRKTAGSGLLILVFFSLIHTEPLPGEDSFSGEEILPGDESGLIDEAFSDEELLPGAESPLIGEFDESLVFEAPPLIIEAAPFSGTRSFDEVFPDLSQDQKNLAASSTGLSYSFEKNGSPALIPGPDSGIDLLSGVMKRKPSHVIESLVLVPYSERELDLLDVYNALSKIKNIQNQQISVNGNNLNTFVETTRIESARNRKSISDPPPADELPYSETIYLRLVDKYIGDLYIRGEISVSLYGMTYDMTNFRDVSYFIFRIMKTEQFSAVIYVEPVKEGVLIYSMSGIYLPGFIVSRVNLTPNINRRLSILINWITEGLKQESKRQKSRFYQLPASAGS
ncbi:MAG: hypothetical protein LBB81_06825 [Treponema sp.]|jgi:hypothetical protein|nr:hypothetical protein [Treponema sp.]